MRASERGRRGNGGGATGASARSVLRNQESHNALTHNNNQAIKQRQAHLDVPDEHVGVESLDVSLVGNAKLRGAKGARVFGGWVELVRHNVRAGLARSASCVGWVVARAGCGTHLAGEGEDVLHVAGGHLVLAAVLDGCMGSAWGVGRGLGCVTLERGRSSRPASKPGRHARGTPVAAEARTGRGQRHGVAIERRGHLAGGHGVLHPLQQLG